MNALQPLSAKPEGWTSDEWETPWELVRQVAGEYGFRVFDTDPCATKANAKAYRFYIKPYGLLRDWEGNVWCNPPYSNVSPWLKKARISATNGATVFVLLPAATDTGWFHDLVLPYAQLHFLRGRVRFLGWQGTPIPAPRNPSLIAIYQPPGARS